MYNLTDDDVNNIMYFLNKVDYKGLKEVEIVANIVGKLQNKIEDHDEI